MASDSNTNSIKLAVAALVVFTLLAIAAGLITPYNVEQSANVQAISGDVAILIANEAPSPLSADSQTILKPGQTVQLQPGSEASVTFTINNGRAHLSGPTTVRLVDSYRQATTLGHAFDNLSRDYTLTLEQTKGTVSYFFANTSPTLDEIQITIQLPDGNFVPTSAAPCWTIDVDTEGHSTTTSIPCP